MSELNHVGLWNRCLEIIRDNVPEQTYKTWFLPITPLKYEDKTLVVQVPSQFFYEFLDTTHGPSPVAASCSTKPLAVSRIEKLDKITLLLMN